MIKLIVCFGNWEIFAYGTGIALIELKFNFKGVPMHFENISHYASLLLYAIMISTLLCSLLTYFVYKLRQLGNAGVNTSAAAGNVRELSSHPSFAVKYSEVTLVSDSGTEFRPIRARKMLRFG